MNDPGLYALEPDIAVTTEASQYTAWTQIDGAMACTIQIRLVVAGSTGTEIRAWVQTSLDGGATACDVACAYFAGHDDAVALFNVSGRTPRTTQLAATNGALADGTANDGLIGDRWRLRVDSVGTYGVGTTVSARISAR